MAGDNANNTWLKSPHRIGDISWCTPSQVNLIPKNGCKQNELPTSSCFRPSQLYQRESASSKIYLRGSLSKVWYFKSFAS